jgi:hypothetical protein
VPERSAALDRMLQEFLDAEKRRAEGGVTLERIYEAVRTLANAQAEHERHDDERFKNIYQYQASSDLRFKHLEADVAEIQKHRAGDGPITIPPMRGKVNTYTEVESRVEDEVKQKLEQVAAESTGPWVNKTPDEVVQIMKPALNAALEAQKIADAAQADRDELALRRAADAAAAAAAEKKRLKDGEIFRELTEAVDAWHKATQAFIASQVR